MKVVCDGCQAKYKLTDGRLAGRTLKFRCRKCGQTIVIDGAEFRPSWAQPQRVTHSTDAFSLDALSAYEAPAPEWYLSIEGEPYGPCTTEQMSNLLCDGQVAWDTYIWREGYADWKAASESNTLVTAAESLLAQAGEMPAEDRVALDPGFDEHDWSGPSSPGQMLPSLAQLQRGAYPQGMPQHEPAYPDVGGAAHAGAHAGDYAAPRVHDEPTRVSYVDPLTGKPPFGEQEASGLIDIRALAALTGSARNPALAGSQRDTFPDAGDERISLRRPGEEGHPDTLAPVTRVRLPRSKAVPFAILSGSVLIAAATVAAIYSSSAATTGASAAVSNGALDDAPIGAGAESDSIAGSRDPAVSPEGQADTEPGPVDQEAPPAPARPQRSTASAARETAHPAATRPSRPAADSNPGSEAEPAAAPQTAEGGERSLDELMDKAVPHHDAQLEHPPTRPVPGGAPLAETPSREQVLGAMRAIDPDVHACTQGQELDSNTVSASFTVVGSTGRVGNVRMSGVHGAVGDCIERAVRNAIFPQFTKGQMRINVPIRLRP